MREKGNPEEPGAPCESAKSRPCCDEDYCVRKYLDQIAGPEATLSERVQTAACEVAHTCHNLRPEDLQLCAGRLFELTPECDLTTLFVTAYQIECDTMEGKKDIQNMQATGRR